MERLLCKKVSYIFFYLISLNNLRFVDAQNEFSFPYLVIRVSKT